MKRTTIAAALPLLMTSGAVFAETQTQKPSNLSHTLLKKHPPLWRVFFIRLGDDLGAGHEAVSWIANNRALTNHRHCSQIRWNEQSKTADTNIASVIAPSGSLSVVLLSVRGTYHVMAIFALIPARKFSPSRSCYSGDGEREQRYRYRFRRQQFSTLC
jgi:hypothetical protein